MTNKELKKKYSKLSIKTWKEGKFWVARCFENSVVSQGFSKTEAQKNLEEALELTFEI